MPVSLPGESHGQRRLVGYSPQGHKELDMTEAAEHSCSHAPALQADFLLFEPPVTLKEVNEKVFSGSRILDFGN